MVCTVYAYVIDVEYIHTDVCVMCAFSKIIDCIKLINQRCD